MKPKLSPPNAHPDDLLYAQLERYVNWRAETRSVAESYEAFRRAESHERAIAFARYVDALDREELAAGYYRRALGVDDRCSAVAGS
jgi:hypothetical protein